MASLAPEEQKEVAREDDIQGFDIGYFDGDVTLDARRFRYGSLSSQCNDFNAATIARIEEAAMCCHLRDFQAALQIFDALPLHLSRHPAIVYEHSQVYWLDWSLFKCETVLSERVAWAKEHVPGFSSPGVYTLLRIVLGKIRAFTIGNFTEARDAMKEVKNWLAKVPIQEYTDVQVNTAQSTIFRRRRGADFLYQSHTASAIIICSSAS